MLSMPAHEAGRVAVYPGAFDPVHLGHIDITRRAAAIFDRVIVAVFNRPNKPLTFSGEMRIELFRRGVADVPNVEVHGYGGLTIDFARTHGASFLIRGLRATSDFEYEYQMNTMNRHLEPRIDTVFLMTSLEYAYLSSSLIKEVAAQGANVMRLVPDFVAEALTGFYGREP
jgi:pantetheine-phosphate adenylyltransferase